MNLLNNWLFQSLFSNLAWIVVVAVFKYLHNYLKEDKVEIVKDEKYSKQLVKKQFNISFWISSVSTIIIFVLLYNHLQYTCPYLFVLLIIIDFWCYIFMLGAFDATFIYFPDDNFNKKH